MQGKRIVWPEPGKTVLERFEIPEIREDELLIRSDYSVVSAGTEKSWFLAMPNASGTFPYYPGYSGSGTVLEVGKAVTQYQPGDRVLVDHKGHRSHAIARESEPTLVKIPNGVSPLDAAFTVIGSMGLQGTRKAKLELGESVLVMGLGILGMFAVNGAHWSGGLPVIAVDFSAERRKKALEFGADAALSPDDPEFAEKIRELTGGRMVNAVVEVSGSAKALPQALEVCAPQARVVLTGCTRVSDEPIDFYRLVHRTGVQIIGAHNFVRPEVDSYPGYWTRKDDFVALMELMKLGRLPAVSLVSEIRSPEEAPAVYQRLAEEKNPPLGVVYDWNLL